jgi:hypothetical protein
MVTTFLSWLLLVGVESDRLRFRLQIHETADAKAAMHYWSDVVGHPLTSFTATSLKRHDPRTRAWVGVAAALTAPSRSQPIY